MVTLGRQLGFDPKRDMLFDGIAHNALADARHQVKFVSEIWQRLLATHQQPPNCNFYRLVAASLYLMERKSWRIKTN